MTDVSQSQQQKRNITHTLIRAVVICAICIVIFFVASPQQSRDIISLSSHTFEIVPKSLSSALEFKPLSNESAANPADGDDERTPVTDFIAASPEEGKSMFKVVPLTDRLRDELNTRIGGPPPSNFDLNVASSLLPPKALPHSLASYNVSIRPPRHLIMECQDMINPKKLLTHGAFTCGDVQRCLPEYFGKYQTDDKSEGYKMQGCHMQSTLIRENNCIFVHSAEKDSPFDSSAYSLDPAHFSDSVKTFAFPQGIHPTCPSA